MMQDDTFQPEVGTDTGDISRDVRKLRPIRFSESEWTRIKTAANRRGISFGGFVRDAALSLAAQQSGPKSPSISSGIEELIKQTFRYTFILATIKRDELSATGSQQSVDAAVMLAREAQDELLSGSQVPPPPP